MVTRVSSHIFRLTGPLTKPVAEDCVDGNDYNDVVDEDGRVALIEFADTPFTPLENDQLIICDCTGGAITVALTSAATYSAKTYVIKKSDASANAVTVDPAGAETIDGSATSSLSSQYQTLVIESNGTNWINIVPVGTGEANLAANVGTGDGTIWRDKTGVTLNFKKLAAGTGMAIANGADEITLSVSSADTKVTVLEGGVVVGTGTIDLDASDFVITEPVANQYGIALAYGTSAGTPSEGNHGHAITDLTGYGTAGNIWYSNGSAVIALGIGSNGQVLKISGGLPGWGTDSTSAGGSGNWTIQTISSANHTADWGEAVNISTGSSNRTVTLTTAVGNNGERILIKKTDSGTGYVIIDAASSQTIDGSLTQILIGQYESIVLYSDGANVFVESRS